MYKNIKNLNLEIIKVEDQVLLVDKDLSSLYEGCLCYDKGTLGIFTASHNFNAYGGACYKIISSNKPLEGLPLLVIEDEFDDIIDQEMVNVMGYEQSRVRSPIYSDDRELAKSVCNRVKSIYKYTEEDLIKAVDMARKRDVDGCIEFEDDEIIQSLTKKELWVDVENYCGSPYTTDRCPKCVDSCDRAYQRPKITNNQIKGIWK